MPFRAVTVGTGSSQIVGYNADRTSLAVWNNGTETIFVSNDRSVDVGKGFPVIAGGGIALKVNEGDEPWMQLYGISPTVPNDVRVVEQFGTKGGD